MNMTLRYNVGEGVYTDKPIDTKRYLSAFGRDVDVDEFELEYHEPTRTYYATGRGRRIDAEMEQKAEDMRAAVLRPHGRPEAQ